MIQKERNQLQSLLLHNKGVPLYDVQGFKGKEDQKINGSLLPYLR